MAALSALLCSRVRLTKAVRDARGDEQRAVRVFQNAAQRSDGALINDAMLLEL